MANQVLDGTSLISIIFDSSLPLWVKVSGDLSDNIAELQSRVVGDDEWGLEKVFTQSDKSAKLPGIDERSIEFRVVVEKIGIKAYWGRLQPTFDAR